MTSNFVALERTLFRRVNSLVEPAVRKGIGSPTLAPASLIVLESTGFKSGAQRRTPLWSFGLGRYRVVSTARGERSFWVKNLLKTPRVSYYLGGKRRESDAIVINGRMTDKQAQALPPIISALVGLISRYAQPGWVFAILVPAKQ